MPAAEDYDTVVTVLVMVIAIYGISKAFDLLFPGRAKGQIDSTQASLLSRAASLTGVTAQRIRDAIEVLFTGRSRRAMVTASQKVFAPTRGQPKANIRNERGDVLVPHETVHAAQAAAGLPYEEEEDSAPQTASEFHRNVRIVLHAMDKDSKRRGWAGHVPDLFDDRIPMDLEKTQRPENIFGRSEIMGDILLTREEDEEGEMRPKEFLLIQAYL